AGGRRPAASARSSKPRPGRNPGSRPAAAGGGRDDGGDERGGQPTPGGPAAGGVPGTGRGPGRRDVRPRLPPAGRRPVRPDRGRGPCRRAGRGREQLAPALTHCREGTVGDRSSDDALDRGNRALVYVLVVIAGVGVLACAGIVTLVALLYQVATPGGP